MPKGFSATRDHAEYGYERVNHTRSLESIGSIRGKIRFSGYGAFQRKRNGRSPMKNRGASLLVFCLKPYMYFHRSGFRSVDFDVVVLESHHTVG